MATLALVAVAVLAVCVFALLGAVIELHRDVRQIRKIVGVLDTPTTLDLGDAIGASVENFGLPAELETRPFALVIFLSETCTTCQIIASSLKDNVPDGLWVVLGGRDGQSTRDFHARHFKSLPSESQQRVIVDVGSRIFGRLGLQTTPAGVRVKDGRIQRATTVPSVRYLESIIPAIVNSKNVSALN